MDWSKCVSRDMKNGDHPLFGPQNGNLAAKRNVGTGGRDVLIHRGGAVDH